MQQLKSNVIKSSHELFGDHTPMLTAIDDLQERCVIGMALQSQVDNIKNTDSKDVTGGHVTALKKSLSDFSKASNTAVTIIDDWLNREKHNSNVFNDLFAGKNDSSKKLIQSFAQSKPFIEKEEDPTTEFGKLKARVMELLNNVCERRSVVFDKELFNQKKAVLQNIRHSILCSKTVDALSESIDLMKENPTLGQKRGLLKFFSSTKTTRSLAVINDISDEIENFRKRSP